MSNRSNTSRRHVRCAIHACNRRAVRGGSVELCIDHRRTLAVELAPRTLTRCMWPGCDEHELGPTRHCAKHVALIAHYGSQYPAVTAVLESIVEDPQPPTTRPAALDGLVYFLRIGGYIKIGWTSDLTKRMKGYPPDTQLLATMPGTRKDEGQLHKRFAHLKTHGREWFPLAPQITEYVDRVIADHGEPPAVDFSARRKQRIVGPRLNRHVGGANKTFGARHVS